MRKISERTVKILLYALFLYFCLFMIFASVSQFFGWSNDYVGYKMIFTFEYGNVRKSTEPFFQFLRFLNDCYFKSSLISIFIFTAVFSFALKWNAFKTITNKNPYFLFFCHTMCFFWILEYTQIRASCAIAIFLCSISNLVRNEPKKYFFKAFLATLFHYSAFTMFVFYIFVKFFKSKRCYILLPAMGFVFAIFCNNLLANSFRDLLYVLEMASGLNKSGNVSDFMSPFNAKYLILLVSFLMNAVFTPKNDRTNCVLMKSMSFGLCIYYWLNPICLPVISVRLAEFYTSCFVLYFFLNIKNFPMKEKIVCWLYNLVIVALYSTASIRVGIL